MSAVDYLTERGLTARRNGYRVHVSPKALITEEIRRYVRAHRLELLAELAANDGIARSLYWRVMLDGKAQPIHQISTSANKVNMR